MIQAADVSAMQLARCVRFQHGDRTYEDVVQWNQPMAAVCRTSATIRTV